MADILEWIYNSHTGYVTEMPTPAAFIELKSGLGWHGPFKSKQEAYDYYTQNKDKNPGWAAPTDSVSGALNGAGEAVVKGVGLGGLTNENITSWFIRIGEVLLGIVLLGVGVAKLTGTTNAVASFVKAKV